MSSRLSLGYVTQAASQALEISIVKILILKALEERTKLSREELTKCMDGYDWRLLRPPPKAGESKEVFEAFIERTTEKIARSLRT